PKPWWNGSRETAALRQPDEPRSEQRQMIQTRVIAAEEADQRLDRWFRKHFPQITQARLEKLLRTGQVRVAGKRAKSNPRLTAGQEVRTPALGGPGGCPAPSRSRRMRLTPEEIGELQGRVLFRD